MLNLSPSTFGAPPASKGSQTFNPSPKSAALFSKSSAVSTPPLQAPLSQVQHECVRRYITREAAQVF